MEKIKLVLKYLQKMGYPNNKVQSLFDSLEYDGENFLLDLKNYIGDEGVDDFCKKAIAKLSSEKGVKVDYDSGEYVYVHIYPKYYDEDESENDIMSDYSWGDSRIQIIDEHGNEEYSTIQELIDTTDMSDWSDLSGTLDSIKSDVWNKVHQNCGFGIWWDEEKKRDQSLS